MSPPDSHERGVEADRLQGLRAQLLLLRLRLWMIAVGLPNVVPDMLVRRVLPKRYAKALHRILRHDFRVEVCVAIDTPSIYLWQLLTPGFALHSFHTYVASHSDRFTEDQRERFALDVEKLATDGPSARYTLPFLATRGPIARVLAILEGPTSASRSSQPLWSSSPVDASRTRFCHQATFEGYVASQIARRAEQELRRGLERSNRRLKQYAERPYRGRERRASEA